MAGEIERYRREDEEKEIHKPLLNSPCSAFHKAVQAILKCLGLESPSSSTSSSSTSLLDEEEDRPGTEIVVETRLMSMVRRFVRKVPFSSGNPGQINGFLCF